MFCRNCGAEVVDNAKFCVACGAALHQIERSAAIVPAQKQPVWENQQQLTRAETLQIMGRVAALIPAIEPDWNQCQQIDREYIRLNGTRVRRGLILPFMIPGGIIAILLGLITYGMIIVGLALASVGVFFLIYDNKRVKKNRAKAAALIPEIEACISNIYKVYSDNQLEAYYPFNYFIPECILEIRRNIIDFRADSVKEAVNVYEQSQFYDQMVMQNAQMIKLMEYTARQARGANIAASTAAAFSAASFFFG